MASVTTNSTVRRCWPVNGRWGSVVADPGRESPAPPWTSGIHSTLTAPTAKTMMIAATMNGVQRFSGGVIRRE
jgi:hypothetical protein